MYCDVPAQVFKLKLNNSFKGLVATQDYKDEIKMFTYSGI